jgi:hypothetical protein
VVRLGEGGNPAAESIADLLQARRGRHRIPAMVKELDHLPAHLQLSQITMQIEPVQALQIEGHMPVQHVVHRDRRQPLEP